MKHTTQQKTIKVKFEHVYNSLEAFLKSLGALEDHEIIIDMPGLQIDKQFMVTVVKGKE